MQVQNNDISRESSCTISYAVIVTKIFLKGFKGPFYRCGSKNVSGVNKMEHSGEVVEYLLGYSGDQNQKSKKKDHFSE